jgi:hypothetical protein
MARTNFLNEEDKVQVISKWRTRWDMVLKESVIVKIEVCKWHPYARLTTDRMESLGVKIESQEAKDAFKSVMRTGAIDLIPREVQLKIQRPEARSRNLLKEKAIEVMWGQLLTASAYAEWKAEHETCKREFWEGVNYMVENLRSGDRLLDLMRDEYRPIFYDAWVRLSRKNDVEVPPMELFVTEAIEDLVSSVPAEEEILRRYSFQTSFYDAPMSDEIAETEARAAEIRAKTVLDSAQALSSKENMDRKRLEIIEDMRREVAEQSEARRREVEQSLARAEDTFYSGISDAINNIRSSIEDKGQMSGRISMQLQNTISKVRSLNVFDDATLNKQMDGLAEAMSYRSQAKGQESKEAALLHLQESLDSASVYLSSQIESLPVMRGVRVVETDRVDESLLVEEAQTRKRGKSTDVNVEAIVDGVGETRRVRRSVSEAA